MTIEELENYRSMSEEIGLLQIQIDSLYNTYKSPTFEKIGSRPLMPNSPTEAAVRKIEELQKLYVDQYNNLLSKTLEIENWLNTLDNQPVKTCIRCHYLLNFTWKQTSKRLYGKGHEYNARKLVYRFFGKEK